MTKIAQFLDFRLSEDDLELVVSHSSGELKKNKAGQWKNYFTAEQERFVSERARKVYSPLSGTILTGLEVGARLLNRIS